MLFALLRVLSVDFLPELPVWLLFNNIMMGSVEIFLDEIVRQLVQFTWNFMRSVPYVCNIGHLAMVSPVLVWCIGFLLPYLLFLCHFDIV